MTSLTVLTPLRVELLAVARPLRAASSIDSITTATASITTDTASITPDTASITPAPARGTVPTATGPAPAAGSALGTAPVTATVIRSGAGPVRAAATARRVSSGAPSPLTDARSRLPAAVTVVVGVAGGLVADLKPGDVVVADRVLGIDGSLVRIIPEAPVLAASLRRRGLVVSVGPIISSDHLVLGARARTESAASGALAVDMESAALARSEWGGPFAVVRAVVDTPERKLISFATLRGGVAALRALRTAVPGLVDWAAFAGVEAVRTAAVPVPCRSRKRLEVP